MSQQAAINRCIRLCETRGWRLAVGLMGNRADAEDVIQQALLVATRKADSIPRFNPWPWFANVITFEARNARRRREVRTAVALESVGDGGALPPDPDAHEPIESLLASELRQRIWDAYRALSDNQREVLSLVHLSGLSMRAAAKVIGIPDSTFRLRHDEALERMRKELGLSTTGAAALAVGALPIPGLGGALAASLAASTASVAPTIFSGVVAMKKSMAVAVSLMALIGAGIGLSVWLGSGADDEGEKRERLPVTSEQLGNATPSGASNAGRGGNRSAPDASVETSSASPATPPQTASADEVDGRDSVGTRPEATETVDIQPAEPVPATASVSTILAGRVIDTTGAPVQGATVSVAYEVSGQAATSPTSETGQTAVTPADGAFSIALVALNPSATVLVAAAHASLAPSVTKRLSLAGQALSDIVLELGWDGEIFGRVVMGDSDAGVEGAVMTLHEMSGKDRELILTWDSGANGDFHVRGLRPGVYALAAEGAARSSRVNTSVEGRPRPIQRAATMLRLRPGDMKKGPEILRMPVMSTLLFRLAPPAGGTVFVALDSGAMGGMDYGHWGVPLDPSNDGVYRADWLTAKHRMVGIKADGFAYTTQRIAPVEGEDLDLGVISLASGATLRGKVVDDHGRGISDAYIELEVGIELPFQAPRGQRVKQPKGAATSNVHGEFAMHAIAAGSYDVICKHAEHGVVRMKASVNLHGDPNPITIVMPLTGGAYGTLSTPPSDAEIVQPRAVEETPRVALIRSDSSQIGNAVVVQPGYRAFLANGSDFITDVGENGVWDLVGVPPGVYHAIALHSGRVAIELNVTIRGRERTRIDFDWQPIEGVVEGRVLSAEGAGVEGVTVTISRNPRLRGPGVALNATTGQDGSYRFVNLFPGTFVITTSRDPSPLTDELIAARTIAVAERETARFDVTLPAQDHVLTGTALVGGRPMITSVSARRVGDTGPLATGEIGGDGSYRVPVSSPGPHHLIFELRESQAGASSFGGVVRYRTHTFLVNVDVPAGGVAASYNFNASKLTGRVTGTDGSPAVGARIVAHHASAPTVVAGSAQTDADGRYEIPMLQHGSFSVTATMEGQVPVVREFTNSGDSVLDLQFTSVAGSISIGVVSIEGVPANDTKWTYATVTVYRLDGAEASIGENPKAAGSTRAVWRPGYNGTTKLDSLEPGRYRVEITGVVETWTVEVVVAPGETTAIKPELRKKTE